MSSAKPDFRQSLAAARPLYAAWLGLASALSVEICAEAGWPAIVLDQQHGAGGPAELLACLTAAKAAGTPALVRVAALDTGLIGRALDAGAQGVVVPMIDTPEQAAELVRAVKYPPRGGRSFGPYRAKQLVEGGYFEGANDWTIACGQIETRSAVENIDAICAVPGFDMIYLGPNDLAISLSGGKTRDIRSPAVLEAIVHVCNRAEAHGVITGIYANDAEYARQLVQMGWQVISIGTDGDWLAAMARQMLPA